MFGFYCVGRYVKLFCSRDIPTCGFPARGTSKSHLVGWDFWRIWGILWDFFEFELPQIAPRLVGFLKCSWDLRWFYFPKWDKSWFLLLFSHTSASFCQNVAQNTSLASLLYTCTLKSNDWSEFELKWTRTKIITRFTCGNLVKKSPAFPTSSHRGMWDF